MVQIQNVKKRLSVNLNKSIEPLIKKYYKQLKISDSANYQLLLLDKDESSDLFFGIIAEKIGSSGHIIEFECKPYSSYESVKRQSEDKIEDFTKKFASWLENLNFYNTDSILNDPILQGYQNEFYNDFRIVDEDADEVSFNYSQQLKLTEFIANIIDNIDSIKNEKNEPIVNEIKSDLIDLQDSVTSETKNGFMKKLSKIIAKARKSGIKISNFILGEFIKGFIKTGGSYAFNFVINNADKLPEYIEKMGQFFSQLKQ